jgi:hypothetical protein
MTQDMLYGPRTRTQAEDAARIDDDWNRKFPKGRSQGVGKRIVRIVDIAPPLSPETIEKLRVLLDK